MNWKSGAGIFLLGTLGLGPQALAQTVQEHTPGTDTTAIYQTENFNPTPTTETSPAVVADTPKVVTPVARLRIIRPKKPEPIKKELSGGLKLNSDGWSLFMEKGWVKSNDTRNSDKFYNTRIVSVELNEHKHPKERREANTHHNIYGSDKPKPIIYGKINNFYALKLGYGYRRMIAGKPDPGTVSIHWVYSGGLSLGLLKPYYIDAYVAAQDNPSSLTKESIKYSEETQSAFLKQQYIVGSSGWAKGLGEIKFTPGIHAKTGLHFDFAASAKTKMALEVGINAELYTQKIELMALQESFPYLVNAYVSFQFGKRY